MRNERVMSDDRDPGDEALLYKCVGFRGLLCVLPLRDLTECSPTWHGASGVAGPCVPTA